MRKSSNDIDIECLSSTDNKPPKKENRALTQSMPVLKKQDEGTVCCRLCDQLIPFSEWNKHSEICIPITSGIQSYRKQLVLLFSFKKKKKLCMKFNFNFLFFLFF